MHKGCLVKKAIMDVKVVALDLSDTDQERGLLKQYGRLGKAAISAMIP